MIDYRLDVYEYGKYPIFVLRESTTAGDLPVYIHKEDKTTSATGDSWKHIVPYSIINLQKVK